MIRLSRQQQRLGGLGKLLAAIFACLLGSTAVGDSNVPWKIKISLDTAPNHVRNKAVDQFASLLRERSNGGLQVEVFPSGQLYKGRDVPKALIWGNLEMGLVSITSLARYDPNVNLLVSPAVYGMPKELTYRLTYGEVGQEVRKRLEQRLRVKVLAPNLDLGFLHLFSTYQPIQSTRDIRGKKIRIPGSAMQMMRFKMQGATPVSLPWSDVPLALAQGGVDGVFSSYETVRSGKLWDAGIGYVYEDRGVFVQYVPMISRQFWNRLPPQWHRLIESTWSEVAVAARVTAQLRQTQARSDIQEQGVKIVVADPQELEGQRQQMQQALPEAADSLRLDKVLLERTINRINDIDKELRGDP